MAEIRESIEYYVDSNMDDDFVEDDTVYETLNLDESYAKVFAPQPVRRLGRIGRFIHAQFKKYGVVASLHVVARTEPVLLCRRFEAWSCPCIRTAYAEEARHCTYGTHSRHYSGACKACSCRSHSSSSRCRCRCCYHSPRRNKGQS